jgi:intracellular sulfur oxidation DsrE/DsrF family protein
MKIQQINKMFLTLVGALGLLGMTAAQAADHKVVIHVDSADPATQNLALNNVANLQKAYGMDNVDIEVVAYGPGLGLLTKSKENAKAAQRVSSLAQQNVTFSACGNTIKKLTKKNGKAPVLADGVGVVPGGVIRIMELQEAGWSYLRP